MTTEVDGLLFVALAISAFLLFGIGVIFSVIGLVRGNRKDLLAWGPVVFEQQVTIGTAGEVLVAIEAPRIGAEHRGLQIQLLEVQTGRVVTLSYSLVTAQGAVYGVGTMKVPFGRLNASGGAYIVRIAGLQPGVDYSRYQLIFSRPYMGRMVLQIIGIVLCGVGMLLSVIWGLWLAGLVRPAQS